MYSNQRWQSSIGNPVQSLELKISDLSHCDSKMQMILNIHEEYIFEIASLVLWSHLVSNCTIYLQRTGKDTISKSSAQENCQPLQSGPTLSACSSAVDQVSLLSSFPSISWAVTAKCVKRPHKVCLTLNSFFSSFCIHCYLIELLMYLIGISLSQLLHNHLI